MDKHFANPVHHPLQRQEIQPVDGEFVAVPLAQILYFDHCRLPFWRGARTRVVTTSARCTCRDLLTQNSFTGQRQWFGATAF